MQLKTEESTDAPRVPDQENRDHVEVCRIDDPDDNTDGGVAYLSFRAGGKSTFRHQRVGRPSRNGQPTSGKHE